MGIALRDVLPLTVILAAAVTFIRLMWSDAQRGGFPSFDTYEVDYPIAAHTLRALREGHGLFWNRFQNCGEPFFASTTVGTFYPPHALGLLLGFDTGVLVVAVLHLIIAGLGTYLLCRQLGFEPMAALCGALAFETGSSTFDLVGWMPYSLLGCHALMPVALWCCERLLAAPTAGRAIALGGVLAVQLLPGQPQPSVFTYQVIALRVVFELLTRRGERPLRMLALVGLGLVLPVGLTAVHLFPRIEFNQVSARGRELTLDEITPTGLLTWTKLLGTIRMRFFGRITFPIVQTALAGLGLFSSLRHRVPFFYGLVGVLYFCLGLDTPIFAWSLHLPLGKVFRIPERSFWVMSLGLAVMAAAGVDAVLRPTVTGWRRLALAPVLVSTLFVLPTVLLMPVGLMPLEWQLLWLVAAAAAAAALVVPGRAIARIVLPAVVLYGAFGFGTRPFLGLLANSDQKIRIHDPLFATLRERMTPQDRMIQVGKHMDFSLQPRVGEIVGVPTVVDYELQMSQRYNEILAVVYDGVVTGSEKQFGIRLLPLVPTNRPLLDLLAVHYLVLDTSLMPPPDDVVDTNLRSEPSVAVFTNPRALPRAFFVPRAEVVAPPRAILARLASPLHDPRQTALIETPPSDGFLGAAAPATGSVEIRSDRSETVELRVDASGPGFLFLSDQDYPGWEATLNGRPAPILRANYAFRLVRVPEGESDVVFRYRPASFRWGAAVSLTTLGTLGLYALSRRRMAPAAS